MKSKVKTQYEKLIRNGSILIESYPSMDTYIFSIKVGGRSHMIMLDKNGTRGLSPDQYKKLIGEMS